LPEGCGAEEYGPAGLLMSSADRGWTGLSAELRRHGEGVILRKATRSDIEICVDIRGNGSVVTWRQGDVLDRTATRPGTIWLSPAGSRHEFTEISSPLPEILHVYLPPDRFSPESLGVDLDEPAANALRCRGGFQDPLLAGIAFAIAAELKTQTSAGMLLADALAGALAARLVQNHRSFSTAQVLPPIAPPHGLDQRRLSRVMDYIEANLEGDLTLDRLASTACLSRFHFVRAFKAAVGRSPHRYVSARRLERAKMLLRGDRPLVDIALALNFSCQANFNRAFRQMTGRTPGEYRRGLSS
jgi:AraC family transcriptional regulator